MWLSRILSHLPDVRWHSTHHNKQCFYLFQANIVVFTQGWSSFTFHLYPFINLYLFVLIENMLTAPKKEIFTPDDMPKWLNSEAYQVYRFTDR